jgi:hypothetical protein
MIVFLKNNERLYDIDTIQKIIEVSRSKIQRELKKMNCDFTVYKNLYLYPEKTLFRLMEVILIENII